MEQNKELEFIHKLMHKKFDDKTVKMFKDKSINEVMGSELELRRDIREATEDICRIIKDNHHIWLDSTNSLKTLMTETESIKSNYDRLRELIMNSQAKVDTAQENSEKEIKKREKYELASQMKVLADSSEIIWQGLESEGSGLVEIALTYMLAEQVYMHLKINKDKVMDSFLAIERQWATIKPLKGQIIKKCKRELANKGNWRDESSNKYVGAVCGLVMLQEVQIVDVCRDFLGVGYRKYIEEPEENREVDEKQEEKIICNRVLEGIEAIKEKVIEFTEIFGYKEVDLAGKKITISYLLAQLTNFATGTSLTSQINWKANKSVSNMRHKMRRRSTLFSETTKNFRKEHTDDLFSGVIKSELAVKNNNYLNNYLPKEIMEFKPKLEFLDFPRHWNKGDSPISVDDIASVLSRMDRRCMVDPMKQWVGWYNRTVQEFLSKLKALLKSYNLSAAQCGNIIRVLNSRENKSDQRWQSVVDDLKGILLELEGHVPGVDISGIDLQLYSLVSNEIAGYVGTTVSDGLKYGVYEYPVQTIESWIASLAERNPSVSMGGSLFIGGRRGSGLALGTGSVSRTKTQWGGGMDMGNLSWRISFVEEDSADLGMHKTTKQKEYDSLVALKRAVSKLIDHYPPHLKGLFKAFHGQCDTILEDCSWFDNHLRSFERPNPGSGETGNGIMYRYLNPNYLQTGQTLYFTLAQQLAEKLKEYTGVVVSKSQGKLKFALSIGNSSTPYPLYHTTENLAVLLSIGHFAYLVLESVATLLISDQKLSNTGVVTAESVDKLSQNLNSITISCFEPLIALYTDSFISNYERIVKSLYPAFFTDQRLDEKTEVWRNVELYVDNNTRKDGDFAQQDFFPVMDTHTSLYSSLGDVDFVYQPKSKQGMQHEEIDPCGGLEPSPALVYLLTLLLSDSRSKLYKLSAELTASLINSLFKQISRRIDTLFSSIFLPSLEPTNEKQDNLTTSVRSGSDDETGSFDATNGAVHAHYSHSSNRCYQVLQLVVDLQYLNRFFLSNITTTPDTNIGENPDAPKQALFFSTTISGIQDYVKTDENQHHQSCYFCSLSANVLASF